MYDVPSQGSKFTETQLDGCHKDKHYMKYGLYINKYYTHIINIPEKPKYRMPSVQTRRRYQDCSLAARLAIKSVNPSSRSI